MKKLIVTLGLLGLLAAGGFAFLLSQAVPEKAPSNPVETDLTERLGG